MGGIGGQVEILHFQRARRAAAGFIHGHAGDERGGVSLRGEGTVSHEFLRDNDIIVSRARGEAGVGKARGRKAPDDGGVGAAADGAAFNGVVRRARDGVPSERGGLVARGRSEARGRVGRSGEGGEGGDFGGGEDAVADLEFVEQAVKYGSGNCERPR